MTKAWLFVTPSRRCGPRPPSPLPSHFPAPRWTRREYWRARLRANDLRNRDLGRYVYLAKCWQAPSLFPTRARTGEEAGAVTAPGFAFIWIVWETARRSASTPRCRTRRTSSPSSLRTCRPRAAAPRRRTTIPSTTYRPPAPLTLPAIWNREEGKEVWWAVCTGSEARPIHR